MNFIIVEANSHCLIILYQSRPWAVLLILLPLVAIHFSLEEAALLRLHTQQTLQFVARLVDAREPFTARHSRHVAQYAAAIAREAQVPLPLQETICTAATRKRRVIARWLRPSGRRPRAPSAAAPRVRPPAPTTSRAPHTRS